MDFYSTPEECLNSKPIRDSIRRASYILEPTAGLGNIVHFINKFKNKKAQVAVNELNESFIPALEKFFPKFDIYNENFFEFETENVFDLIICNPPFSIGKDSKAYLDFLIKCIYMLNISETERRERVLIFICPPIIKNDQTWKVGEFNGFDFGEVVKNIPFERMNRMSKLLQNIELDKKEYKAFQNGESYDDMDKLMPYQSEWLGSCNGFGGTNIQAEIYKFIMI
jgi:phospholipid N-methyltransferase